ncbi:MAG: hypothetical protein QOG46_228 [Pseudonocardiales bacterium]|jgi:hypothetical protein|nr:hypothetical protein [Pseudonocardiales bacterium]
MALWHTLRVPLTACEGTTTMGEQGATAALNSRSTLANLLDSIRI